jgi:hypothetical protein
MEAARERIRTLLDQHNNQLSAPTNYWFWPRIEISAMPTAGSRGPQFLLPSAHQFG